jgi:hypothetical protein
MFHKGARLAGGNLDGVVSTKVTKLLDEFTDLVAKEVRVAQLPRAVVRSMLPCSLLLLLDSRNLWAAGQKESGMPSTTSLDHHDKTFAIDEIYQAAKWEFGFDDPFVIRFPAELLDQESNVRMSALVAIARTLVESERQRVHHQMNIVQINPVFGPASYVIDQRLTFVLMPFTNDFTKIYQTFIKPTVERPEFNLVCKRADDIKSNRAIIQDIWKSLCESRLVIADLTGLNPNVMYELGVAHTLGKETVLIYQRGENIEFPFDLAHIRRIEYDNTATGGRTLEQELRDTIAHVLAATIHA